MLLEVTKNQTMFFFLGCCCFNTVGEGSFVVVLFLHVGHDVKVSGVRVTMANLG
jgi:hypothetical protein